MKREESKNKLCIKNQNWVYVALDITLKTLTIGSTGYLENEILSRGKNKQTLKERIVSAFMVLELTDDSNSKR